MRLSDYDIVNVGTGVEGYGVVRRVTFNTFVNWKCRVWFGRGSDWSIKAELVGKVLIRKRDKSEGFVIDDCPIFVHTYKKNLDPDVERAFTEGCENMDYDDIIYYLNSVTMVSAREFRVLSISECNITL